MNRRPNHHQDSHQPDGTVGRYAPVGAGAPHLVQSEHRTRTAQQGTHVTQCNDGLGQPKWQLPRDLVRSAVIVLALGFVVVLAVPAARGQPAAGLMALCFLSRALRVVNDRDRDPPR
jgi:hypothetical protein